MAMTIRRLVPEDAAAWQALRLYALTESPSAFGTSYEEECVVAMEEVARQLGEGSGRYLFGAFDGDTLVGMVGVGRETGLKERHRAFLRSVFVSPGQRGSGLGRSLLTQALAFAETLPGVLQVTLAVTAGNEPALRLYLGLGFEVYGRAPGALLVEGRLYDEFHMVRHLNSI